MAMLEISLGYNYDRHFLRFAGGIGFFAMAADECRGIR